MTTLVHRLRHRDESGFTVVELAVTLVLLSIVSVVLIDFLNNTTKVTARTSENVQAENDAQIALRTMTEDLRGAYVVASCASSTACASSITVYVSRPSAQVTGCSIAGYTGTIPPPYSTITYSLPAGSTTLVQTRTETATNCTTTTTKWQNRPVIKNLVANSAVFSYYDGNGALVDLTSGAGSTFVNGGLSGIKVNLSVKYRGSSTPLTFTSIASLRNARQKSS